MNASEDDATNFSQLQKRFEWDIPQFYNIGIDVCDKHLAHGTRPALLFEDKNGMRGVVSFGELKLHSDRLANALRGLGVARGDRVAVVLPQCAEAAITHIAVYKLGAIAVPLATLFGRDALEYRLRDSGCTLAIVHDAKAPLVEDISTALQSLKHVVTCNTKDLKDPFWTLIENASEAFAFEQTRADDPAMLIYTSGTTGAPKGALNAHRCLLGNLPGFVLSHNGFPMLDDVMWTPADWAWTGGLLDALLPALHFGVPVLSYDGGKFDPQKAFALMERFAVRNAFIPPTALKMMMQVASPANRYRLQLRSVMSAGEQLGAEVLAWAERELNVVVNEMWGQTEFNYLVGNACNILTVKPGSMGKPYPGHDVRVIDDAGNVAPPHVTGELAARCGDPVMFLGYWQNPSALQEKLSGPWFRTGDLGYQDEDGYLWFLGRKDDVITSAGHRVGPGEVEDCLLKHAAVAQAAVVGSPDALRGNVIKAFIVLAAGYEPSASLIEDIQAMVKSRLAAHEYPRAIEFIDALPMTSTGKVRRIELRERELKSSKDDQ